MRLQQPFAIQKEKPKLKIVLLFWWMTSIPLDELFFHAVAVINDCYPKSLNTFTLAR